MTMKTAEEYRAEATRSYERIRESRERFDTDGFLSNWASGLGANLANTRADLLDAGKVAKFPGLYEGDRRVKARTIRTKFGNSWLLHEDEADLIERRGKKFLPWGPRSRIHKSLGLEVRTEMAPAWADYGGSGKGLAGASTVHVAVFRTGDKWGADAVLVNEEKG
jgi:hypothetical protein